jgi:DoxX-like family
LKTKLIAYWVTTAIVAFVLLAGGGADLAHQKDTVEIMLQLGYPLYVTTILGVWKLLGGVVLLAPGLPRLKEWAYAGTIFDLTGAVASHVACGETVGHYVAPIIFAVLALASWALRPQSRALGVIIPAKWRA